MSSVLKCKKSFSFLSSLCWTCKFEMCMHIRTETEIERYEKNEKDTKKGSDKRIKSKWDQFKWNETVLDERKMCSKVQQLDNQKYISLLKKIENLMTVRDKGDRHSGYEYSDKNIHDRKFIWKVYETQSWKTKRKRMRKMKSSEKNWNKFQTIVCFSGRRRRERDFCFFNFCSTISFIFHAFFDFIVEFDFKIVD